MRISYNQVRRFQEGGPMEAPEEQGMPQEEQAAPEEQGMPQEEQAAPEEQGQGDPIMQLAQIFAQGLQNQDCQALAQGAQMFLQMVQQQQGGGQEAPQSEPVFRRGGVLAYRIRK